MYMYIYIDTGSGVSDRTCGLTQGAGIASRSPSASRPVAG